MLWITLSLWSIWFKHPIKLQHQQHQQWQAGPKDPESAREWLTEYRKLQAAKSTWIPDLTESDIEELRWFINMTPSRSVEKGIVFIKKIWIWEMVLLRLSELENGGFAFIQGNKRTYKPFQKGMVEAEKWFLLNGWDLNKRMWRDYHIYKKPHGGGIFLVQHAA